MPKSPMYYGNSKSINLMRGGGGGETPKIAFNFPFPKQCKNIESIGTINDWLYFFVCDGLLLILYELFKFCLCI